MSRKERRIRKLQRYLFKHEGNNGSVSYIFETKGMSKEEIQEIIDEYSRTMIHLVMVGKSKEELPEEVYFTNSIGQANDYMEEKKGKYKSVVLRSHKDYLSKVDEYMRLVG